MTIRRLLGVTSTSAARRATSPAGPTSRVERRREVVRRRRRPSRRCAARGCSPARRASAASRTRSTSCAKRWSTTSTRARDWFEHARERLAAEARVDAEQRAARVAAAAVQREQLEVVLEQHRDVRRAARRRSRRAGAAGSARRARTRRGTARYVHARSSCSRIARSATVGMVRARLDLGADDGGAIEAGRLCGHGSLRCEAPVSRARRTRG